MSEEQNGEPGRGEPKRRFKAVRELAERGDPAYADRHTANFEELADQLDELARENLSRARKETASWKRKVAQAKLGMDLTKAYANLVIAGDRRRLIKSGKA